MTVAATAERIEATFDYLRRRAEQGMAAPTNKEIAIKALRMGKQKFQPWDRTQGIKWPKPEHGAVMIAALELDGRIEVERGRNWRRITIVETGQVLEPQKIVGGTSEARKRYAEALDRLRDEFGVDAPRVGGNLRRID